MTQPNDDEVLDEILTTFDRESAYGKNPQRYNDAKQAITAHFAKKQELAELRARRDERQEQVDAIYDKAGGYVGVSESIEIKHHEARIAQLDAAIKEKEEA